MSNQELNTKIEELLAKDESAFTNALAGIRNNRISVDFLGAIPVVKADKKAKISHIASIRTPSVKDLIVTVFEKKDLQAVTKSILDADLGYQLQKSEGQSIYFTLAPMNEEIKIKMAHKCKDILENAKISFRNTRIKILNEVKKSKLPIDQDKRTRKQIDEIVNAWGARATKTYEQKVAELSKF